MDYEIVIGLEVHVQLKTASKLFCGCRTGFGAAANTQVCPVCLGLPGVLPVINQQAFDYGLKAALALNCRVAPFTKFDRKNYFYPDLPKNYQVSQYDQPLAQDGYLEIGSGKQAKKIGIIRAHLEEDAGKLMHPEEPRVASGVMRNDSGVPSQTGCQASQTPGLPDGKAGAQRTTHDAFSRVDLNRTGVPLLEIVSQPEINSPEEAYQYLTTLKGLLEYLDISDCDMEKGSLRCDANLSVRPQGVKELGTKTELKNLNSFKFIAKALDYEAARQINLLTAGGRVAAETRLWNTEKEETLLMRSKEEVHDYRYFPEPDLVPVKVDETWLKRIGDSIPELPKTRKNRFVTQYQIPEYDAGVLTQDKSLADYFEACLKYYPAPKSISNWIMGEVLRALNEEKLAIRDFVIKPQTLVELIKRVDAKEITSMTAKEVFNEMRKTGQTAGEIIQAKGLTQISDQKALEGIIDEVIGKNSKIVADYKGGKEAALMALVGQVMRASRGKANPQAAKEILKTKLGG